MRNTVRTLLLVIGAFVIGSIAIRSLSAQQPGPSVKRTVLLKQDMTIPGREAVMASVEIPPGGAEGKHTHPAEVYAFVLEGTVTLEVEGLPTRTLNPGEVFTIPPGKIHEGSNRGTSVARLAAVFVAEKGKPLTTQVH